MGKLEKVEFYVLLLTIIAAGVVSALDLMGLLPSLGDSIPTITLLMVALIAGSLLLGMYNTRRFMKSVLPLGNFRRFKSKAEAADYILHRIGFAGSRVWDITWADPLDRGFTFDEKERRRYFNRIERASSKNLTYRELMMFCGLEERTRKARRLIERTGKGYELKAIPDLPEGPPHRWQFVIVDDEVILDTFATDQEDIVEYFCRYYESQWASAKPIRLGDAGGIDRLEQFLDEHVRFADDESTDRADKEYVDDSISIDTELAS